MYTGVASTLAPGTEFAPVDECIYNVVPELHFFVPALAIDQP